MKKKLRSENNKAYDLPEVVAWALVGSLEHPVVELSATLKDGLMK